MRRAGNPWQLLVAVLVAGFVANAVGSTAFKVLIWVVFALYVLVQVAPYISAMGRWIDRLPWGRPKGDKNHFNDIDNPYWKAYLAMMSKDLDKVRPYIERDGVDPFAHFPAHMSPICAARTLYDFAVESSFDDARVYFEQWQSGRAPQPKNQH